MSRLFVIVVSLLLSGPVFADAPFNLAGRISIRQQETAYHGTLNWAHSQSTDELVLAGPLGQGVAQLRRDAGGVVLQLPNGERHEAATLDALADKFFGAPVPIAPLPDWMRGVASAGAQRDEMQRPTRLVLSGWTVEWLRYDANGRPLLLSLESERVGVRLRIDSWTESVAIEGQP